MAERGGPLGASESAVSLLALKNLPVGTPPGDARQAMFAPDRARTEAAEARVDDLMVQVQRLAETEARAGLLQIEADRSRAEAERLRAEIAAARARLLPRGSKSVIEKPTPT